jgi:hypothetical protein
MIVSTPSSGDMGVIDAARIYSAKGWRPIPLRPGEKAPREKNWTSDTTTDADPVKRFVERDNIGLKLGGPEKLVDVDIDDELASEVAFWYLPQTQMSHGRASSRSSHHFYLADPLPRPLKFCDDKGACLIELRSSGNRAWSRPLVIRAERDWSGSTPVNLPRSTEAS